MLGGLDKTLVRGQSRSLENGTIRKLGYSFTCEFCSNYGHIHILQNWVRGCLSSLKMAPFESLCTGSYSPSIVTMAVTCFISEIEQDLCSALPYGRFPSSLTPSRPVLGRHLQFFVADIAFFCLQ